MSRLGHRAAVLREPAKGLVAEPLCARLKAEGLEAASTESAGHHVASRPLLMGITEAGSGKAAFFLKESCPA